ncbi:glutamate--cysteine ligase [bacterium]|nr:glutamate--cysteine ligase [bacterium]
MKETFPLKLFTGYGIELEFMIVDQITLQVKPVADRLLATLAGPGASEAEVGVIGWSNELALHVLELKTNGPSSSLIGLADRFHENIVRANTILETEGAMLMPTAMHPWMDPESETRLWPHEQNEIYRAYDRIFGVRGHGWSNVQSTHINLPFGDDEEFARLHAAIRIVLPLIPAIAASSPIVEGRVTGLLDTRLDYYRRNQHAVPSIAGQMIPEPVHSIDEYHKKILKRIYRDIEPHDPDGLLQHEWLNSRGAIARFDRGAIEIRLLDIQESPRADIAIVASVVALVRALSEERWVRLSALNKIKTSTLESLLLKSIRQGEAALVEAPDVLHAFGDSHAIPITMGDLWAKLVKQLFSPDELAQEGWGGILKTIFTEGTLARRILRAIGSNHTRSSRTQVYGELCRCLAEGHPFHAPIR